MPACMTPTPSQLPPPSPRPPPRPAPAPPPPSQATTLRAEEHGTLRRFASRLNELEAQVASERGTPSKSEGEWMERTMALRQELNTTQEIAQVCARTTTCACTHARIHMHALLMHEQQETDAPGLQSTAVPVWADGHVRGRSACEDA